MDYNGKEKRKFVRARFPCKITLYAQPERVISTHTENISAGGIRVIISEKIEAETTVNLEIELKKNIISAQAKIIWVVDKESPYRQGLVYHDTGIAFISIKDQDREVVQNLIEEIISEKP